MSTFIYGKRKFEIISQARNLTTGTLYAIPVTSGYTPDATAADPLVSDIPLTARSVLIANAQPLNTRVFAQNGADASFDADDVTFPAVGAGSPIVAVVITDGKLETDHLIAYIDDMINLPITPDGRDFKCAWSAPMVVF